MANRKVKTIIATMEAPVVELQDSDEIKYCHVVCICTNTKLSLCGAYKPKLCGAPYWEAKDEKTCSVCGNPVCIDCIGMACPICGAL